MLLSTVLNTVTASYEILNLSVASWCRAFRHAISRTCQPRCGLPHWVCLEKENRNFSVWSES